MLSLNRATIIGNATRDPELRYTPNGQSVASFAVATNRSYIDQSGEKKETVEFHDVVTWGKLAEICNQYLNKGQLVYVEGRLHTRRWKDDDDSDHGPHGSPRREPVQNHGLFIPRLSRNLKQGIGFVHRKMTGRFISR